MYTKDVFAPPVEGRRGTGWLKPPEMVAPILRTKAEIPTGSSRGLLLRSYNKAF